MAIPIFILLIATLLGMCCMCLPQLYLRVFYLNGSLDKWWLLLFAIPPLNIIPMIFFFMNWIKSAPKTESPIDYYMWLPVLANIFGSSLSGWLLEGNKEDPDYEEPGIGNKIMQSFVTMLLPIIAGIAAFYLRDLTMCEVQYKVVPDISNAITNAIITQGFSQMMYGLLFYIPYIKFGIMFVDNISFLKYLVLTIMYISFYIIINMLNSSSAKSYCKSEVNSGRITMASIASLVLVVNEVRRFFF
jgi:hypothetical protein